jgi:hypothetical protein
MPEITLEDEIEAVRSALHLRDHWVAMNQPNSTLWLENKARADALRRALARLEASRWRPISEAPPEHALLLLCDSDVLAGVFSGSHAALERTGATHWMLAPSPPSAASEDTK